MKVIKRDVKPDENETPTNSLYDIDKGNLCLLCGKCFNKLSFLYTHLEKHGIKNLCHECGKYYVNVDSYKEHVLTHKRPNSWACSRCGKVFKGKDELKVHTRFHKGVKPYGCNICSKRFFQSCHLIYHQRIHNNEHPFSCADCGKSFSIKGNLKIHTRIHSGIKPYTCVHCKKSFSDPGAFNRHKIIHNGLKPYKCKKCPSAFADYGSLSRHKLLHGTECPFSCDHCNKSFRTKAYLLKHIVCHDSNRETFTCKICKSKFAYRRNLYLHSRIHNDKENRCKICNKNFTAEQYLQRHIAVHIKPFQCEICDRKFANLRYLGAHIKTEHLSDKPFSCDQCSESFSTKTKLKNHMKYHNSEQGFTGKICGNSSNFQCDVCNKRFARLPYLAAHLASEHPSEQYDKKGQKLESNAQTATLDRAPIPDSCVEKSASSKILRSKKTLQDRKLEIDINTTYKRIFNCDSCAMQFTRKSDINKHVLSHDPTSGNPITKQQRPSLRAKSNKGDMRIDETELCKITIDCQTYKGSEQKKVRYTCHICNKTFPSNSDVKKHYLVHSARNVKDRRSGNVEMRIQVKQKVLEKAGNDSNRDTYSISSHNATKNILGQQILDKFSVESPHDLNQHSNCFSEVDLETSSQTYGKRDNNEDTPDNERSFNMSMKRTSSNEAQNLNDFERFGSNSSRDISNNDRISSPLQLEFEDATSADEPNSVGVQNSHFDACSAITVNRIESTVKSISCNKIKDKIYTESNVRDFDRISKTLQSEVDDDVSRVSVRGSVEVHNINNNNSSSAIVNGNNSTVKSVLCNVVEDKLSTEETVNSGRASNGNDSAGFVREVRRKRTRINYKDLESGALMNMIDVPSRSSKMRKKHIFSVSGRSIQY